MTEESGNGGLVALTTTLAREGLYAEATKVLQKALVGGQCSEAEALDLQTRIYTQEGLDLQAESCWPKVQHLGGLDPTYDRALSRLGQSRLSRGNLFHLTIALAVVAVLGLLLWQTLVVSPEFDNRLTSNEKSLAELREGLAEIKRSTQADDQELTENITSLNSKLTALGQQVSERLVELSTATGVVKEHTVAIARLNGKIETIEKVFESGFKSFDTRHTKALAPEAKPSATDRIAEVSPQTPRSTSRITAPQGPVTNSSRPGKPSVKGLPSAPIEVSPTGSSPTLDRHRVSAAATDIAAISAEPPKEGKVSQEIVKSLSAGTDKSESKVPELRQIGMSIQQEIPSMTLSMVVYSDMPKKRMIVINGRSMREGDEVTSGLVLEQIVPNGAIFKFRGWTFRKGFF